MHTNQNMPELNQYDEILEERRENRAWEWYFSFHSSTIAVDKALTACVQKESDIE